MNKNIRRYLSDGTEILLDDEYNLLKRRGINYSKEERDAMRMYEKYWKTFAAKWFTIEGCMFSLDNEADLKILEDLVKRNLT